MYGEGMRRFLRDIQKQQEAWAKIARPHAEIIQKMNAQMKPYKPMAEHVRKEVEAITKAAEPFRQSLAKMQASLEPMRDMVRRVLAQQEAVKENYRSAQNYLFDEGWYLGGDMPVPNYEKLANLVDEDRHADIEEAMCEWARDELDGITHSATKTLPHRADIITDAIDAHRAGTYSLSIPVLLAQSDGIANEIIGNCLFRGDPLRALERTLARFDGFPLSEFADIVLDPLRSKSCFYTCSPRQVLKCGNTPANRSEILHGSQLDYASESNSLRAIVLLGYLLGVKSVLESHSDEVERLREALDEAMASGGTPDVATDAPTDPHDESR